MSKLLLLVLFLLCICLLQTESRSAGVRHSQHQRQRQVWERPTSRREVRQQRRQPTRPFPVNHPANVRNAPHVAEHAPLSVNNWFLNPYSQDQGSVFPQQPRPHRTGQFQQQTIPYGRNYQAFGSRLHNDQPEFQWMRPGFGAYDQQIDWSPLEIEVSEGNMHPFDYLFPITDFNFGGRRNHDTFPNRRTTQQDVDDAIRDLEIELEEIGNAAMELFESDTREDEDAEMLLPLLNVIESVIRDQKQTSFPIETEISSPRVTWIPVLFNLPPVAHDSESSEESSESSPPQTVQNGNTNESKDEDIDPSYIFPEFQIPQTKDESVEEPDVPNDILKKQEQENQDSQHPDFEWIFQGQEPVQNNEVDVDEDSVVMHILKQHEKETENADKYNKQSEKPMPEIEFIPLKFQEDAQAIEHENVDQSKRDEDKYEVMTNLEEDQNEQDSADVRKFMDELAIQQAAVPDYEFWANSHVYT